MARAFNTSFITDEIAGVQAGHVKVLEQLCRGEQPAYVPVYASHVFPVPYTGPFNPSGWLAGVLDELRKLSGKLRDPVTHHPFALSLLRYDLHFASAVMGCPVRAGEGTCPVWWTSLTQMGKRIEDFRPPDLDTNPLFTEMLELLRFVVDATGGRIPVEIPYVSEPLVAAVDVFGESFLEMLLLEPELAERVLDDIQTTILEMRNRFFAAVPGATLRASGFTSRILPDGYTLLYQCTTHLVSGETYRDHFAQRDRELFRCHAHGGSIHLCGKHTQHIPAWQNMPELKAYQLNNTACLDLEKYWRNMRPDQFIIFMPCPEVTIDDAIRITGGRRLVVNAEVGEPIPVK